jgi:pimeloyl-ACP methyl ester carboxylesterase
MAQTNSRPLSLLDNGAIIDVNGVEICVEAFGNPDDPAILLIHGATTPMHGWEDEFCQRLAAGSRFVIRYDQRDTGRSVSYPPGQPGYAMDDLVADAIGLLDAFELAQAHLVGISMGGGIAVGAALDYPERVASITLIATSPGGPDLPPMADDFLAFISQREQPDWSDREAVIDHIISFLWILKGDSDHLDKIAMRARLAFSLDRTTNIASSQINHFVMETGVPIRDRLGDIDVPTLVIHGDEDPIFPLGHAEALQREIPGAELLLLEQTGHLLLRPTWDSVVPALLAHTSSDPTSSRSRNDAE